MNGSRRVRPRAGAEIDPDEILLDASNLPSFDPTRLEGRLELPIAKRSVALLGLFACLVLGVFSARLFSLQVMNGEAYAAQSEANRLERSLIFSERGVIYDRTGSVLVSNAVADGEEYATRSYPQQGGLAHVLGYVAYPRRDENGVYYQSDIAGKAGVEAAYDALLSGEHGLKLTERDARGDVRSEGLVRKPKDGENLTLSIDAAVTSALFESIRRTAEEAGYRGGSGVIMDVETGEILALTSYPEYSSDVLSAGVQAERIARYQEDPATPFLDRAVSGLYAPGSIVKPFVAAAALEEGIISPEKEILSTGALTLPNPYDPEKPSVFRDWKAHGYTDMREAIAVSSDVYFYTIGGGFQDQRGLGIAAIERYMRSFGFGENTGIVLQGEAVGVIPTPEWKARVFDESTWRVGDTYNTAIGQYGFQVTPVQMARSTAALANGGFLLSPVLVAGVAQEETRVPLSSAALAVAREGMRMAVTQGTALGLSNQHVAVAAKTGTAQVGARNEFQNAWVIGFFPYEHPRYAFAVVMERAKAGTGTGAVYAMRQLLDWMAVNAPDYLK
jgi:penicillin-binding protein 2